MELFQNQNYLNVTTDTNTNAANIKIKPMKPIKQAERIKYVNTRTHKKSAVDN